LKFDENVSKRQFEVKFSCIYSGHKIIGKEVIEFTDHIDQEKSKTIIDDALNRSWVRHDYTAFNDNVVETIPLFTNDSFVTHMINTFFKAPFRVCRKRLHKSFQDNGLISRFEPCSNAAVNLRFHYNEETKDSYSLMGKCTNTNDSLCGCKDISVSCFNSGKMNITGLATLPQGDVVYGFLRKYFLEHRTEIESLL